MRKPRTLDSGKINPKDVKLFAKTMTGPDKVGFKATFMFGPFGTAGEGKKDERKK